MERAGILYSTVHKAKGLEWPVVCIGRDFEQGLVDALIEERELAHDFMNIVYVALTRGTRKLICPKIVLEYARKGNGLVGSAKG